MTEHDVRNPLLRQLLHSAMVEARDRSASLRPDSSDRHFYLGVALAAAFEVHPEGADARPENWLDLEHPPLRDGYLAMQARIAAVLMSGGQLPPRVRLPEPG